MQKHSILLIGSGGREHALAWKLSQSPRLEKLYIAPGNPGMVSFGELVPIPATDTPGLVSFAKEKKVTLVLVGPDDPLANGITDALKEAGIPVFGPTKAAARIEWSKAYAKDFMARHGIPTAEHMTFADFESAVSYVDKKEYPLVIKASGLALGKGVIIVRSRSEAVSALREMMLDKVFGTAGSEVVIEEFMEGVEISTHAFSDGVTWRLFPASQDHKRARDDDKGLNTGGMGAVAPLPFVTREMLAEIDQKIILPTIRGLEKDGSPFVGCLFTGIMLTKKGPKVIEYNARFGDPETQAYMRLLDTDLVDIVEACGLGRLREVEVRWKKMYACNVVVASGGYPGHYEKGHAITGIKDVEEDSSVVVFQAGTKKEGGTLITSGGRVLGVSVLANTLPEALRKAYDAIVKIHFHGMQYRRDIGKKALSILS